MGTQLRYRYGAPSLFEPDGPGGRAQLDLATSGGIGIDQLPLASPYFFSGFAEHPAVVAQGLLMLARVARTRFYVPPTTMAAILRAADPVVTSTPQGLRMESFSVCCGVYARLDVDRDALDAEHTAAGVTNVDVNPPLRAALAGLRAHEPLHLRVGSDELRVATLDEEVVEEKVELPSRWLKGFAETQFAAAGMRPQLDLDAVAARRFVQGLPRTSTTSSVMWATPAARGVRLASGPSRGAVCVAGAERLRVIEPLLRFATGLRAYARDASVGDLPAASAWVLQLAGARVTVVLSPEKSRGFSGEGGVLAGLAADTTRDDAALVATLLAFEPRIDPVALTQDASLSAERVHAALGALACSGQVGYDLATAAYFHRPLPLDLDASLGQHPRLLASQALLAAGAVTANAGGFEVRSAGATYRVALTSADASCTCPWFAKYRGTRGPCKHVLAARTFEDRGR